MDLGIAGRIALVTGADSGIGFHRGGHRLPVLEPRQFRQRVQ